MEALEGKGCRLPLMKGEAELAEKLAAITRQVAFFFFGPLTFCDVLQHLLLKSIHISNLQLKGSGAELSRRVQNLLTISRVQANSIVGGGSVYLPGSTKIHEQSLADMQEVRQRASCVFGGFCFVIQFLDIDKNHFLFLSYAGDYPKYPLRTLGLKLRVLGLFILCILLSLKV